MGGLKSLDRRAISEAPTNVSKAVRSLSKEALTPPPAEGDVDLKDCELGMDVGYENIEDTNVSWSGERDFRASGASWQTANNLNKQGRPESLGASNLKRVINLYPTHKDASHTSPGSDQLAHKRARISTTIERPYVILKKRSKSELSQYQAVSYRSIDSLARSYSDAGSQPTAQVHPNSRPRKL